MEHILHRQKPNQIQQLTPQKRATVGLFFHKMYIQCLLYVTHYKIPIHPITFVYMLMICSQHTPWFHGRWLDCCPTYRFHHATTFCRHFLFIFFFYFISGVLLLLCSEYLMYVNHVTKRYRRLLRAHIFFRTSFLPSSSSLRGLSTHYSSG